MSKSKFYNLTIFVLVFALVFATPNMGFTAFADGEDEMLEEPAVSSETIEPNLPSPEDEAKAKAEAEKQSLQQRMDNINQQLKELESQQDEIKKNLNSAKSEVANKQAVVNEIGAEISYTQNEIYLLEEKMYLLGMDIQEKEDNIKAKQKEYDDNYKTFLGRFRTMNMHNNASTLGLILGTDSYVEFLTTADTVNRIASHDKNLMENLTKEKKELEEEKKALESSKDMLNETRGTTEAKKQVLAGKHEVAVNEAQSVTNLQQQFENELAASQAKAQAMESEINQIYQQIKMSDNPYAGGVMQWPVPSAGQITSAYGWRFGGSDFHTGIDISDAAVLGQPVVAANDGTVVYTNWANSPGVGYGIYIMIDHGGNISTLYGHLSNISVQQGQQVKRGETIGSVGSTGWSTGPHLHFEVRINGGHVDPQPYVTG